MSHSARVREHAGAEYVLKASLYLSRGDVLGWVGGDFPDGST